MPAKKTVKRTSKNSRTSKLTRSINFSTTKGKFLLFVLTFAVVGGVYMAYVSFAATTEVTILADNMALLNATSYRGSETDSSKRSTKYIGLGSTSSGSHGIALTDAGYIATVVLPGGSKNVRACAMIRRMGTSNFNLTAGSTSTPEPYDVFKDFLDMPASTNYINVCTPYSPSSIVGGKFLIRVDHVKGAEIRVASVVLDWY